MIATIDIHCHILPGIDDGPKDLDGALEMARAAVTAGIGTVAATPHLRPDFPGVKVDEIAGRCEELNDVLRTEEIPLTVVPAAEVSLGWALDADDQKLRMASYGQNGSDVLIEALVAGPMLPAMLGAVASRGYRVLLAHVERLEDLSAAQVEQLVDRGIVLQVNADSATRSSKTSRTAETTKRLISSGMVSVVASDGHSGTGARPITSLGQARTFLQAKFGEAAADAMTERAPGSILTGSPLPNLQPLQAPRRGRLFGRSA